MELFDQENSYFSRSDDFSEMEKTRKTLRHRVDMGPQSMDGYRTKYFYQDLEWILMNVPVV